jgi:hypothetical protein
MVERAASVLLFLALDACSAAPCPVVARQPAAEPLAPAAAAPKSRASSCPIWYAPLAQRQAAAIPARFAADIPSDPDAFRAMQYDNDAKAPAWEYLTDGVCHGDPDILRRARESVERAVSQLTAEELKEQYDALFGGCWSNRAPCELARRELVEGTLPKTGELFTEVIEHCQDPETEAYFERPDVPPASYLRWYQNTNAGSLAQLQLMVGKAVTQGPLEDVSSAALQLASRADPESKQLILKLYRQQRDPVRRAAIGLSFRELPDQRVEHQKSCKRAALVPALEDASGYLCRQDASTPLREADPVRTAQREFNEHARDGLSEEQKARLAPIFQQCAAAGDTERRADCLSMLAVVAPPLGRAEAEEYVADPSIALRELSLAIVHYPDNEALHAALQQLGLAVQSRVEPWLGRLRPLNLLEPVLEEPLRLGDGPHQGELALLYAMRWSMPGLERVVFDEPAVESGRPRLLSAYDGQRRYDTPLTTSPLAVDVVTSVGLMNSLARAQGSATRVALAAEGDAASLAPLSLVAGSERALCELDQNKLLRLARVSRQP